MTRPVYILAAHHDRWCRLLTIGAARLVTACRDPISVDWPVFLKTRLSPGDQPCGACDRDLRVRVARGDGLQVYADELGVQADVALETEGIELPSPDLMHDSTRTITADLRGRCTVVGAAEEWDVAGVGEP
ncbi:MAG TPA: hypothetical protein VJO33_12035 [Gemmatimonadaceae bacterium]|nr:hypothetical protein [Gemmatimonadaceae bacterium]